MLTFVLVSHGTAWAIGLTDRNTPRLMQSIRALGMGNAIIAAQGTDESALFYNVAAVNDYEEKFHFWFQLPTTETSYKAIPFFASDLLDLADDIDNAGTDSAKINVFDAFAAQNTGRYEEIGVRGTLVTVMHKYLTASLFYENRSVLALINPVSSTVNLETSTMGGVIIGSSYGFFKDNIQVGAALKFVGRHFIDETITQRDVVVNDDFSDAINYKRFGLGIGGDVGIKAKFPLEGNRVWDYLDPTFALTIQDVGDTRFFMMDDVGRIEQSVSLGAAIHPHFWQLKSLVTADVRDLDHRSEFVNKFGFGYELTWPEISKILKQASIRAGINQGYLAGGFGFDFKYFRLDAATWGRSLSYQTRQKQSRMLGLTMSGGF